MTDGETTPISLTLDEAKRQRLEQLEGGLEENLAQLQALTARFGNEISQLTDDEKREVAEIIQESLHEDEPELAALVIEAFGLEPATEEE